MPPEPSRVREHREGARFSRPQPGEAPGEPPDAALEDLFFGDERRESIQEAYERGRRDEREQVGGDDPDGIAAWVAAAVQRPPAEPDITAVFRIDNPRGTRRKLDALVRVQVDRLPPRQAARALKELTSERGRAPRPKRNDPAEAGPFLREE